MVRAETLAGRPQIRCDQVVPYERDHVIQDEAALRNIRKCILHNPASWKLDTNTLEERAS
jgi:hypothetical protein